MNIFNRNPQVTIFNPLEMVLAGVVLGDVAGSIYEGIFVGDSGAYTEDKPLYQESCFFTDDTILSIATTKALQENKIPQFKENYAYFGKKYRGGYGGGFVNWLDDEEKKPYNSYGNGSAMRVAPVAVFAKDKEDCIRLAYESARMTHDHYEGVKGAITTALAVYMGLHNESKEETIAMLLKAYPGANMSLAELMNDGERFRVSCQRTMPIVIRCFIESEDYEGAIKKALLFNGDTDTHAAIVGGIALSHYKCLSKESYKTWLKIREDSIFGEITK